MSICHHCRMTIEVEGKITRDDVCSNCRSDLRCCLNCRFFNESAHNKCDEPVTEFVGVRDRSNFCEFFELNSCSAAGDDDDNGMDQARSAFDSLFK